jgi:hypothetical protein
MCFTPAACCREHLGVHPCDKRRPLAHYRANFPAVDFSAVEEEEDILWLEEHRESAADLQARHPSHACSLGSQHRTHTLLLHGFPDKCRATIVALAAQQEQHTSHVVLAA